MNVVVAAPVQAVAPPFAISAPWADGITNVVGGPGYFYGEGTHTGGDHYAVDINGLGGGNTDCGQEIRATAAGSVSSAGSSGTGYGTQVVIDHGGGWSSRYAHLQSVAVSSGQPVSRGQRIGALGTTGNSTGCHLHFVIYKDGASQPPSPMSGVALFDGVHVMSDNRCDACTGAGRYPDGSFVHVAGRDIYRIAGGAPLYINDCSALGGCSPLYEVGGLDAYERVPVNGTTIATTGTGRIYKFAGGAPLWLNSCSAGCGSPIGVNQYTVDALDHMYPVPSDGTTLATEPTGRIYKVAGGAPLWLSSCDAGCGSPVVINQGVIDRLDHLNPVPANGTTLATTPTGRIYKVAGGAPLWLSSCDAGCGSPVVITQNEVDRLEHMNAVPSDGATLATVQTGRIYKVAGGAPFWLGTCDPGCGSPTVVNQAEIDRLEHLLDRPRESTLIRGVEEGRIYRVAGGAPIHITSCAGIGGCSGVVTLNQANIDRLERLNAFPVNGTFLRAGESGRTYRVAGGAPLDVHDCGAVGSCGEPVVVNQAAIDARDHMNLAPADGTHLAGMPSSERWRIVNGCATAATDAPDAVGIEDRVIWRFDCLPPRSLLATSSMLEETSGIVVGDSVVGASSDDLSGIEAVIVSFADAMGSITSVEATLACTGSVQRACDWTANVPGVGVYTFVAHAIDKSGNTEEPTARRMIIRVQ